MRLEGSRNVENRRSSEFRAKSLISCLTSAYFMVRTRKKFETGMPAPVNARSGRQFSSPAAPALSSSPRSESIFLAASARQNRSRVHYNGSPAVSVRLASASKGQASSTGDPPSRTLHFRDQIVSPKSGVVMNRAVCYISLSLCVFLCDRGQPQVGHAGTFSAGSLKSV